MLSLFRVGRPQGEAITAAPAPQIAWTYGLQEPLHDDPDAQTDIICVHGLNGDRLNTFSEFGPDGTRHLWISEDLPQTLLTQGFKCRVFSYGYNAATHAGRLSLQDLWDHGEQLLSAVADKRAVEGTQERPIIWFTHSLGGLVVKNALHKSYLATVGDSPNTKSLFLSTHAIFFFGVPHQGGAPGTVSLGQIALNIVGSTRATNNKIVDILEPGNQALKTQFESYKMISHLFHQRSFWETYETPVKFRNMEVKRLLVVPKESAIPPGQKNDQATPLMKDHLGLVKFASKNDPDYAAVTDALILELRKSFRPITVRWNEWNRELKQANYAPPRIHTNWPFPPNQKFKGRKEELAKLKSLLQGHEGFRVVTIDGVAGVGKTSLALAYGYAATFNHSIIFWVPATSKTSVEDAYIWLIGEIIRDLAQDAPGRRIDYHLLASELGLQGVLGSEGDINIPENGQKERDMIVLSVKNWFARQPNPSWLIIFDNHDDLKLPLRDFFPKCNWGSYLITSRRPQIRDYGTTPINLQGLSLIDGKALLLAGLERDFEVEEVDKCADDIVRLVDYHPLAIDQAGAYLRRRPHVPMREYIRKFERKEMDTRPRELLEQNENLWPDYPLTCMTTFEVSREAMDEENPHALQVLQHCSWLDRDDIWVEFLREHVQSIGNEITEDNIDDLIGLLYSYAFIVAKVGKDSFAIHAVIHIWSRERLSFEEQTVSMLKSFQSLVHSPYESTGDGEIYAIQGDDFVLQRSAVHHIEYALEIGNDIIGFWAFRSSAEDLNESEEALRVAAFDCLDVACQGAKSIADYPKPDPKNIRPSPIRSPKVNSSPDLVKETWKTIATLSGIVYEQGRYRLSQQFQLRTLAFLFTFSADTFERLMKPDIYNDQILITFLLIAIHFQHAGNIKAAEHIWVFLNSKFLPHYQVDPSLREQAQLAQESYRRDLLPHSFLDTQEPPAFRDLDDVQSALKFVRSSKNAEDTPEQMHLTMESVKIVANRCFEQEDLETAEHLFDKLRKKRAEFLPNGELEYFLSCLDLGNCLRLRGGIRQDQDDLAKAENFAQEALDGLARLVGDEDPRTARSMVSLSSVWIFQGRPDKAEEKLSRLMVLYRKIEANRVDIIMAQEKLAQARINLGKIGMAEATCRSCVSRILDIYPITHPHCLRLFALWSQCLRRMSCIVPAFAVLRFILECKVALGKFDRAFQQARKDFQLVINDFSQGNHTGQKPAMTKDMNRYNTAWLRSRGIVVVPKGEAENLQNRGSEVGLLGDIDIPDLTDSID